MEFGKAALRVAGKRFAVPAVGEGKLGVGLENCKGAFWQDRIQYPPTEVGGDVLEYFSFSSAGGYPRRSKDRGSLAR